MGSILVSSCALSEPSLFKPLSAVIEAFTVVPLLVATLNRGHPL